MDNFLFKYDQYCALVREFLGEDFYKMDYSRFTNDLIRDYMFELKKVLYEFTSDEMLELFRRYNFASIKTLNSYSGAYKSFIFFVMGKDDLNVRRNVMLEDRLSRRNLFSMNTTCYYDEEDITEICNNIEMNRCYYETIIRIIYENVAQNIESAVRIKIYDVDLANRKAIVNGVERPLSYKLANAISELLTLNKFETNNREIQLEHRFDTLIPIVKYRSVEKIDEATYYKRLSHNTSRAITRIDDLNGHKLSVTAIYSSGIINCLNKEFDSDELLRIFSDNDVRSGDAWKREMSGKITNYLIKNGYSKRAARFGDVKYCYRAYLLNKIK